jgi:hypothetical protein
MSWNPASDSYSQASDWLIGTVKRNPEGLLLLAAGCALMMRTGRSQARDDGSRIDSRMESNNRGHEDWARRYDHDSRPGPGRSNSNVGDRISDAARNASDYASDLKDQVADAATSYASSAADYAGAAGRVVSDQSERMVRQARSTIEHATNRVLRDQPLVVALVGLAAGAAVAAAFPTTAIERHTLGEAGEKLTEVTGKAGEQLKDATAKAGERLMSAADERGLNSEGLKEVARDVAGTFGQAFSSGGEKSMGQAPARSGSQPGPGPGGQPDSFRGANSSSGRPGNPSGAAGVGQSSSVSPGSSGRSSS